MEVTAVQSSLPTSRSTQEIWGDILENLEASLATQSIKTWLAPCQPVNIIDNKFFLKVPSRFHFEWIKSHYLSVMQKVSREVYGAELVFDFVVPSDNENREEISLATGDEPEVSVEPKPIRSKRVLGIQLNPRYTFDNFISIRSNKFAMKSALHVAQNPINTNFNPLYLYGPTGMGKTHLLHAIGNEIMENSELVVGYFPSERFAFEYVKALKNGQLEKFIQNFRSADVLLFDDLQFLSSKRKLQEEFFHAFNELHNQNKLIVISADRPPSKLADFNPRLLSRLQWGLISDLNLPDEESRLEIINNKCQYDSVEISSEIKELIATQVSTNIRELEGVVIRMLAQSSLLGDDLTVDMAKKVIFQLTPQMQLTSGAIARSGVSVKDILEVVADVYAKPVSLITGPSRRRDISRIRKMAAYCCKKFSNHSLQTIANEFGRSHAFVIQSIKDIKQLLEKEPDLQFEIEKIKNLINS